MSNSFKGEFKVTTQQALGKSDLKRLRASLMEEFPRLTKRMLDKVLPTSQDIALMKCSNGTQLYVPGEGPPTFFDDGFGGVFPTLFTLWKLPPFMPELVTHGPVSKFLLPKERSAGADMMLPGVIVPDGGLGAFGEGQKRVLRVEGNDAPFGVGKMLIGDGEIAAKGMKGKGMAVLHVYRDSLWASRLDRKVPNDGFGADEIAPAASAPPPAAAAAEEEEDDEEDEGSDDEGSERPSGPRASGPRGSAGGDVEPMAPDALLEYCFYAALKTSCTDAELPITADKFYAHHMQPARPAGQPQLDAKKTVHKQIGKYIKHMHKQKALAMKDFKGEIKILSVDRTAAPYVNFELAEGGSHAATAAGNEGPEALAGPAGLIVWEPLRAKPPVVSYVWQPNSYTRALFEAVGFSKNDYFTQDEAHAALDTYVRTRLRASLAAEAAGGGAAAQAGGAPPTAAQAAAAACAAGGEVAGFLRRAGLAGGSAAALGAGLAAEGYDSVRALRAGGLGAPGLESFGASGAEAALAAAALGGAPPGAVRALLVREGVSAEAASACADALAAEGFDSVDALRAGGPEGAAALAPFAPAASAADAAAFVLAMSKAKLGDAAAGGGAGGAGGGDAEADGAPVDPAAVPLDGVLLNSLVKVAGGSKKGATFASHLPLAELKEKMTERMTAFHRVAVEGEAASIRKGALKLITVEMKRAAGHNKTHVHGLESFGIRPEDVAQALKKALGCTTAVLKLPGNNVKDMEVLLQGHCVNEVCDYLANVYCIDKQWLDLKLKESKRSNT